MSLYFQSHDECEKTDSLCLFKTTNGSEFISEECHSHYPKEDSRYTSSTVTILKDSVLKITPKKCFVLKRISLYFSLLRIKCIV